MSQTLDRMSTLDAEFLYAEHHNVPMHTSGRSRYSRGRPRGRRDR
jgi:hypothetical protein